MIVIPFPFIFYRKSKKWKEEFSQRGEMMFKLTEAAYRVLEKAVNEETNSTNEKLFIRLNMGIG